MTNGFEDADGAAWRGAPVNPPAVPATGLTGVKGVAARGVGVFSSPQKNRGCGWLREPVAKDAMTKMNATTVEMIAQMPRHDSGPPVSSAKTAADATRYVIALPK